jgi:serine-type D-Ala-D-Ala carboxypeptidase (penicillin-binding protein 5/6)
MGIRKRNAARGGRCAPQRARPRTALAALLLPLALAPLACGSAMRHTAPPVPVPVSVEHRPGISPAGFPLGPPAFKLTGLAPIGRAVRNAVPVAFRKPPRAGLLVDLDSGRVLWQLNALVPLRIASLTKMMTALVAVKSAPPDAEVLVHRDDVQAPGSRIGELTIGRRVLFETMLNGLLLVSGNDAAAAIAEHVSGSVARFVRRMNEEAARLGLECTRFSSPSGFIDARNFSCAADLAALAHVLLAQPRLARIVATPYAVLPFPIKGGKLYLYNNNPLLVLRYPGVDGVKTGFTDAAGQCLVATVRRGHRWLGVVLLHAGDTSTEAQQVLNAGFTKPGQS